MFVIGTAGHVDHGKSTLITALTGINPDRLAEEQERQMTIDLGFAWHTLPSGEEIGIVDVPGHRDFIENMLAGVGGVDAILFVVAADEGIMPQSREHLNIVKLLGIEMGLIVLTKIDLVEDADLMELVQGDIKDLVQGSFLENAPIVQVSASRKEGLDALEKEIDNLLQNKASQKSGKIPRLPIDRVFSIKGFGTIVTGTLIGGSFSVGDQVEILPRGISSRIRGLQTHKKKEESASPGNRTAVNLIGVEVQDITRGDVLCLPNTIQPTSMLDVEVEVLKDYSEKLKHDDEVKIFVGTAQRIARVRVLGDRDISPGINGFVQLMIAGQVVVQNGDRLILRRPSPAATIGGGTVISSHPQKRYKRFVADVVERLEMQISGDLPDRVLMIISDNKFADYESIVRKANKPEADINLAIQTLVGQNKVIEIEDRGNENRKWWITIGDWSTMQRNAHNLLSEFHHAHPLRRGIEIQLLQKELALDRHIFGAVLQKYVKENIFRIDNKLVALPKFTPSLTKDQQVRVHTLMKTFENSEITPPSVKESIDLIGEDVFHYLIDSKMLKLISPAVVFTPNRLEKIIQETRELLERNETMTVADFRDHFNTSRKYAIALLEYMDKEKITEREGDYRKKFTC